MMQYMHVINTFNCDNIDERGSWPLDGFEVVIELKRSGGNRAFYQFTYFHHWEISMKVFRALVCFAALSSASFYLNANAAVLRYQMNNVHLSDGSGVHGYVDFDSTTDSIVNFDVSQFPLIPPSCAMCDWTEAYIGPNPIDATMNPPALTFTYARPIRGDASDLYLSFSPSWKLGDASMGLLAGPDSYYEASTDGPLQILNVVSGDVTLLGTVPEPSVLALMGLGLVVGGVLRRRSVSTLGSLQR
jgi:hypothetical protein